MENHGQFFSCCCRPLHIQDVPKTECHEFESQNFQNKHMGHVVSSKLTSFSRSTFAASILSFIFTRIKMAATNDQMFILK